MKEYPTIGNSKTVKSANMASILNTIRYNHGLSRIRISELTGLSAGATSALVNELIANRLVAEYGEGDSSGGRKPILLKIREDCNYVIGIDMSQKNKIVIALINFAGHVISSVETRYSYGYHTIENITDNIITEINNLLKQLREAESKIFGIGIAVAGILNKEREKVIFAIDLVFDYEILVNALKGRFKVPVYIENDTSLEALAENEYGAGKNQGNLFYMSVKSGIGAGIIIDNKIFHGPLGGAGEIGRIIMDLSATASNAPTRGYFEEYVTEESIRRKVVASQISGRKSALSQVKDLKLEMIAKYAEEGDLLCVEIIQEVGTILGFAVNTIIGFYSVPLIVIGGTIIKLGPQLIKVINDTLKDYSYTVFSDKVSVAPSILQDNAALVGASAYIIQKIFNSPELILDI